MSPRGPVPGAAWASSPHGDWVPMATAPPDRRWKLLVFSRLDLETGAGNYPESLADHDAHLPTHGSVSWRSTQVCVGSPPKSRSQPCLGPCLGLREQTHCHIDLFVIQTRLLWSHFLAGCQPRATLSFRRSPTRLFVSHAIDNVSSHHPLRLLVPASPLCCQLEKTPCF